MSVSVMSEHEFCIKLVNAVEKHNCLYNFKSPDYSKKDSVEQAWNEVAYEVNVEAFKCRTKWRNIRTVFMRHLKLGAGKRNRPYYLKTQLQFLMPYLKPSTFEISDDGTSNYSNDFDYYEMPSFSGYNEEDKLETKGLLEEEEDYDNEAINIKQDPSPTLEMELEQGQDAKRKFSNHNYELPLTKKTKKDESQKNTKNSCNCRINKAKEEEPKRAFLISLLPDLECLNNSEMRQFKKKVLNVIDEIIDSRPSTSKHSTPRSGSETEINEIN